MQPNANNGATRAEVTSGGRLHVAVANALHSRVAHMTLLASVRVARMIEETWQEKRKAAIAKST